MTPDQRLQEGTHMTGHGISTAVERTAAADQPRQRKGERVLITRASSKIAAYQAEA
jgi:hypothetical protein